MGGMHTTTGYNHQQRLLANAKDVFSCAKHFHFTHMEVLDQLSARVYDDPAYKRLSSERRGYLAGWIASMHERMYDKLEWRVFWRGQLVKSQDVISGTWNEVESEKGRHVYIDKPECCY